MNPNKKILNPKNNSPWLLCPSKSFPGKFYYFNGSTGETAWCFSETDKNLKKDTVHRVTDKTHTYPEPVEPPIDDSTNTTNSLTSLKNTGTEFSNAKETRPTPVFGQAVFPKYVSPDNFAHQFVWALAPMCVPSQLSYRQMLDQVTPTNQPILVPNNFQPLKTNFTPGFQFQNEFQYKDTDQTAHFNCFNLSKEAQTLAKPPMKDEACQTFVPIRANSLKTQSESPKLRFDQTAKFNCFNLSKEAQTLARPPMKDEACQISVPIRAKRLRTQLESDLTSKPVLKASRSVENLTSLFTKVVETSTISPPYKVDNETGKLSELDKNDLRFKLVAKKRKVEGATETEKTVKSADQSTSKPRKILTPKKHVTFDIQESASHSSDDVELEEPDQSPESSMMEQLNRPAPGVPWYVVTDTTALLEDWQCIEDFVKSDPHCRLLVPHAVYTELEGCSRDDAGALSARQLIRKLAVHVSHIVVQSKPEYELSPEDSILQCCWTLLQENIDVVLISNNTNMLSEAKSMDLECYSLDGIKKDNQTTAEPQNDLKKPITIEENYKNKSKNLFMQDLSEVDDLCLPKPKGFRVCESRNNILETGTDTASQFSKIDANSDRLIDLTRPRVNTIFNSEITNVKDQITKKNYNSNRTTKIMKNVFMTTVLNNKMDQDTTTVDIGNHNFNEKSTDRNNSDMNNQNVPRTLDITDEIDRDIGRLNVTENNIEKSRDIKKVSGITKLYNQSNLDEDLQRFYIKNAVVENRLKSRLDEWECRLNQTMEGVLTEILLEKRNKIKRMMPPWNLFEAIQVTRETFKNQPFLKSIIDRFSTKLLERSTNTGKFNKNMKPNDLMNLIGLSMVLIEHLKEIDNSRELYEAEDMLVDLINNIEDPKSDIDLSLEKVNTPISSRSEIYDVQVPVGFKKSRKEIVDYLKKHFAAWQTLETDNLTNAAKDKTTNKVANVVITCGKDLNTLKINNSKAITVENKEADKTDVANQPKVTRNVKIIPAFEERLKNKAILDKYQLDYAANDTIDTVPSDDDVQITKGNDTIYTVSSGDDVEIKKENYTIYTVSSGDDVKIKKGNDTIHTVSSGDDVKIKKEKDTTSTMSSDVDVKLNDGNVKTRLYPSVKMFLVTVKGTLIKTFHFIKASQQEYQEGMSMDKKADTLWKVELTRKCLLKISERLKNIIERESSEGTTLKDILIKAGEYIEEDRIIANYRETIEAFLEQTQLLEKALELMLSLLNAVSAEVKEELFSNSLTTSPILPSRRLRSNKRKLTNGD